MKKTFIGIFLFPVFSFAQLHWNNVDSLYQPLPDGVHVYFTNDSLNGKPNKAFYLIAPLKNKQLDFTTQVGNGKRYTPSQYYEQEGQPILVVNGTFFEFAHNSNLNLVVKDARLRAYNKQSIAGKGKDTLTYKHPLASAIGISTKRIPDVAWTYTDSTLKFPLAVQSPVPFIKDSFPVLLKNRLYKDQFFKKWKMQTAIGGGPVLVQHGVSKITNNEEIKFSGKALFDKHPRTAMGYTSSGELIVMVVEGRFPGKAEGADLKQLSDMLVQVGCEEALNLDGGGSSCMLVNGKQTITPSDKEGQRPVPAVFIIKHQ